MKLSTSLVRASASAPDIPNKNLIQKKMNINDIQINSGASLLFSSPICQKVCA